MKKSIFLNSIILLLLGYFIFELIENSKNKNKYEVNEISFSYNETREKLNIPIIELDWMQKRNSDVFVKFFDKDSVTNGHICKFISLSKSDNGVEYDFFKINNTVYITIYVRNLKEGIIICKQNCIDNSCFNLKLLDDKKVKLVHPNDANKLFKENNIDFIFKENWKYKYFN